ncbi:MAG TPA: hypothetical protein DCP97_04440 [Ruminococcaceae bacterium]|nr:hypothetical protein [Oscillospiraceae bacterium]
MIKLHFEKLYNHNRNGEPCNVAIPFKKGALTDTSNVVVTNGSKPVLTQCKPTARWEDNSIKWLLVNFLADLPANKSADYFCDISCKKNDNIGTVAVKAQTNGTKAAIQTGAITINLAKAGSKNIFESIITPQGQYDSNCFDGPYLTDKNNSRYTAVVGEQGWELIESGPVRAIAETKGKHCDKNGNTLFDYVLRIIAFAGKEWVKAEYQIISREKEDIEIKALEFAIKCSDGSADDVATAVANSNYTTEVVHGKGAEKISKLIDSEMLVYEANEHIPEVFYGTLFADWKNSQKGVAATIYQAHQNFPKAVAADGSGIIISIVPECGDKVVLRSGMARTQRFLLHFHSADTSLKEIGAVSERFQMPDKPMLEPDVFEQSGALENVFVHNRKPEIERYLISKADGRAKAYGMLNWGDAPDMGYTLQGRANGKIVWTNNEYDFPHAAMLMYARTGTRRFLDYMLVAAEHWYDVDVCHYSENPLYMGGQWEHCGGHTHLRVVCSHQWVEGLFDYYHITGERTAYQTAIGIGENILRLLETPMFQQKGEINARETGWALRSLVALYKETNDKKWLEKCDWIVGHFEDWKKEYGGWLSPYTDNTSIRVVFMIAIAACSLMRYYRVKPQEKLKTMILEAIDDVIENCILENGLFLYKELPSLSRLGTNTIILEALAIAYEFTGDIKYLEVGMPTFEVNIKASGGGDVPKRKQEDAVITGGAGPKGFAQAFYPVTVFYKAATENGLIK